MKICKVEGCSSKYCAKGYCGRHYMQIKRYGKVLKRTIFDKNEIVKHSNYAEIIICNIKHIEIARAIISSKDISKVKGYKWHLDGKGYIATNLDNNWCGIHRIIMKDKLSKEKPQVDHINHNKIDNRKENLRICNNQENNRNKKGVLGIGWQKNSNKWQAYITINHRMKHLGLFKNKEEALKVRRQAELKYFGEFAK